MSARLRIVLARWSSRLPAGLLALMALVLVPQARAQDPGVPGSQAVAVEEYNLGDQAFKTADFPAGVELRGTVTYPASLAGGPYPVVLILHGRHWTCYDSTGLAYAQWPCSAGRSPVPSHQGYDYLARLLASQGHVVISVSANGISAADASLADVGMQARAELLQRHLDLWKGYSTTGGGPFGNRFVGRLDLQNIGTLGHSRGGEGVVRHYLLNKSRGSPYGIKAVLPLAPVNFLRSVVPGVPLSVILPYCDGDVTDLQGVHFFDEARYAQAGDPAPKHYALVMGANHNYFNTVWTPGLFPAGTADDWHWLDVPDADPHCASKSADRLTAAQQRNVAAVYVAAFFRTYLGGETGFQALLKGDAPMPATAQGSTVRMAYQAPDSGGQRRDVNRLLTTTAHTTNTLGGPVAESGFALADLCGGPGEAAHCLTTPVAAQQPHAGGLSQLHLSWTSTAASYTNQIPAGARDLRSYQTLQFRAGLDFADSRVSAATPVDLTVRLSDGAGHVADAAVSAYSRALAYPPGKTAVLPKSVLSTVRVPLSAFSGVDMADVRSVQLLFNRAAKGAVLVSDLAFTDAAPVSTPTPTPVSVPARDATSQTALPDLQIATLTNPPLRAWRQQPFWVYDTVINGPAAPAAASTSRFYLAVGPSRDGSQVRLGGERAAAALLPGTVSGGWTRVAIPSTMPRGDYYLLACADDHAAVQESSEGNNCKASGTRVKVQ